ncbi:radical SAM/SPASM domain-containing protein [Synergistales bacterium]|nr:radical SAM/SPASM domain-containing protein [Synergistales bacterium]
MLIILKATNDCNLACHYCSNSSGVDSQTITTKAAEALVGQLSPLLLDGETIDLLWHGGEPTLLPIKLFEEIQSLFVKLSQDTGHHLKTMMQTNGFDISMEWRERLLHFEVSVGVSVDGPVFLHDTIRPTMGGGGTYERVIQNTRLMVSDGIPTSLLCVVREEHTRHVWDIVQWLKEIDLPIRFNPLLACGRSEEALSEKAYYQFLRDIFTIFLSLSMDVKAEPLSEMLSGVLFDRRTTECSFSGTCGRSIFTLFPDGDIGPCGRSSIRYGNILKSSLPELLNCGAQNYLAERGTRLDKTCGGCSIRPWCNGGCPTANGDLPSAEYCSERKAFFDWLSTKGIALFQESLVREKNVLKNDLRVLKTAREEFERLSDV